jgi:hypothetical protein
MMSTAKRLRCPKTFGRLENAKSLNNIKNIRQYWQEINLKLYVTVKKHNLSRHNIHFLFNSEM